MLAAHGGVHGATSGILVDCVHDILHHDAVSNFRTFRPKSGGGARVIVNSKDVRGKLTKADFVHKHNCLACCMTKMAALWVRQKAAAPVEYAAAQRTHQTKIGSPPSTSVRTVIGCPHCCYFSEACVASAMHPHAVSKAHVPAQP